MAVEIPHFALPLRFAGSRAVVVEQDSADEVAMCVEAAARTIRGERDEAPEFGVPDSLFGEVDLDELRDALVASEPRVEPIVELIERPADLRASIVNVLLGEN